MQLVRNIEQIYQQRSASCKLSDFGINSEVPNSDTNENTRSTIIPINRTY